MSLYLWINILSFAGPFFLSFDKKVAFFKKWKTLFPGIIIVGIIFLIWDQYFTENLIWGFNKAYLTGIYFGDLPLEECLFFFTVPYACVFIYECLKAYIPVLKITGFVYVFSLFFSLTGIVLAIVFSENWYTFWALLLASLLNLVVFFGFSFKWYNHFVFAFLIAFIPFLIVNGILTGGFTDEPIVWYNENHIMGARIGTIPVEDNYYNLLMLLPIVLIHEGLQSVFRKKA